VIVVNVGKHYGSDDPETRIGKGKFIGTERQGGTDEEQRADARTIYSRLVGSLGAKVSNTSVGGFVIGSATTPTK
jgi:hypothetical protein